MFEIRKQPATKKAKYKCKTTQLDFILLSSSMDSRKKKLCILKSSFRILMLICQQNMKKFSWLMQVLLKSTLLTHRILNT